MKKDIILSAAQKDFKAYISMPAGEPRGGLIVLEEIWGVNENIRDITDRFAREGYVALAPELLGDTGILEKMSPEIFADMRDPAKAHAAQAKMREIMQPMQTKDFADLTLARLASCFEYLKDAASGKKIGILGFCFGGTWSFFFASKEPGISAAIPFYGQPPAPLDAVKDIACPVLAFYGEQDERLMTSLPQLILAMETYGKDFAHKVYPGAGHAFFNDRRPEAYRKEAAEDAWRMTLDFLSKHIG
jgi:carboxymethylenebutenolidase